jgi:hypothetical protein
MIDPAAGGGNCANPTAPEGRMLYNADYHILQYCDGTNWIGVGAGGGGGGGQTFDAGSGFFVMSHAEWDSNLGNLTGADAKCLSDLTANDWQGKSFAQNAGLLDSTHIHAWLCNGSTCNNATASKKYYFAASGHPTLGGASFTATSAKKGPGDSVNWTNDDHFGGPYLYWTNRDWSSNTQWGTTNYNSSVCSNWGNSSANLCNVMAYADATDRSRFNADDCRYCFETFHLICLVNP